MVFWAGISIFSIILFYIGAPWIYSRWLRLTLKIRVTRLRAFVLTYDDGPGSKLTRTILSILDEHNAKASFFLSGSNIAGREDIVKEIRAAGHEICSHGYNHLDYRKVSLFRALSDIERGWKAIDVALGTNENVYPFRPPYGKLTLVCLLYLWFRRAPIVYWTVDCGDTLPCEKRSNQRMASLAKKAGGAVTLAHDFERTDRSVDNMVIESTRLALSMAKDTGMHVMTISQLLRNRK